MYGIAARQWVFGMKKDSASIQKIMPVKVGGVISAAGLSSRMHDFKPLLPIGELPMLLHTVNCLRQSGVSPIWVVLGKRAEELEALLTFDDVIPLRNACFAKTDMLASVKIAFAQVLKSDCDGVVFLPVDVSLVRPWTVRMLIETFAAKPEKILFPVYENQRCHPPIIPVHVMPAILAYQGEDGLRGALECASAEIGEQLVPDLGCTLDADNQEDYQACMVYYQRMEKPDRESIQGIYAWANTPYEVQQHCQAVAQFALELGERAVKTGFSLDLELLESAALLHDVLRTEKKHALAGAALLAEMGMDAVAALVREHMELETDHAYQLDERALLYYADKRLMGTNRVTLEERLRAAYAIHGQQPGKKAAVQKRIQQALIIEQQLRQHGIIEE